MLPQYDPSGHIRFKANKDGVILANSRGDLRQIKNTGDYDVPIHISKNGLRERKRLESAKPTDIFVVGDSFSFGWGVEEKERFSNQIELLRPQDQVFNISAPTDFNGYEKLINYAIEQGATIKRLIVGVTMENDLINYKFEVDHSQIIKNDKNEDRLIDIFTSFKSIKGFFRNYSAAYFFATSIFHNNAYLRSVMIKLGLIIPNHKGVFHSILSSEVIENSATRLKGLTRDYDAIILIIPSRSLWLGPQEQRLEAQSNHNNFLKALTKNKIRFVDMQGPMEKSNSPLNYHFKYDGHWAKNGHRLAAEELVKMLKPVNGKI